jgi:tetrahydromethanopterin S-methyltransferase subunit G
MTDEMTNLVLEHLRHIRTKVDRIDERVDRVEIRLSAVEGHLANLMVSEAAQNAAIDNVSRRLEKIERRLDLADR